tara:strand:+ start:615 stop:1076 length:462 start_codon:yes stop_codon:yes gene_type:complete
MTIYHRCETCFYSVKTGDEYRQKQITCPYDEDTMLHHYVDDMSIFTNFEEFTSSDRPGYYSLALGRIVDSKGDEEEIMKERGFVKESELTADTEWYEKWWKVENEREAEINRLTTIYNNALAEGMTAEEACTMAFTAEDAISGKLDKLFKKGA